MPSSITNIIHGVKLIPLTKHVDTRGTLVALEKGSEIPFPPRRIFFITVADRCSTRAGHSSNCMELIVLLSGTCNIQFDNGQERALVSLQPIAEGLWIEAGVWLRLSNFASNTIIAVVASMPYDKTKYFEKPNFRSSSPT